MSNEGGVPGQGAQDPQDPPYGQPSPGGRPEQPNEQPNPYGQEPVQPGPQAPDPDPYRQHPQYGQYAPPGYQFQAPVPTGPSVPWAPPSIGESHGFAWRSFGRNAGVWIVMVLLLGVVTIGGFFVANPWFLQTMSEMFDAAASGDQSASLRMNAEIEERATSPMFLLTNGVLGVVASVAGMTLYAGALASTRRQRIGFGDFFGLRNWGGILLLTVIVGVVGAVVGMIPFLGDLLGIVVGFLLVAAPYFVLDKQLNAIEAIGASFKLVTSNLGTGVLGYLVYIGYTFAGACLCGLGLFATFPFAVIFGAHLYRRLQNESIEADQNPTPAY
ncbi:hypothetical protein [Myceligenerans crystallogenes]|uniref:Integral membrane protein n=1 Tax=Myceligenerans crystallogenes TaxID=316335 RepID=A0ABN2NG77_9MICO